MSCSRLLVKGFISRKVFLFVDSRKPFELTLIYKRMVPHQPKSKLRVKTQRIKEERHSYAKEEDCRKTLRQLQNGYCFKCGQVDFCRVFET